MRREGEDEDGDGGIGCLSGGYVCGYDKPKEGSSYEYEKSRIRS